MPLTDQPIRNGQPANIVSDSGYGPKIDPKIEIVDLDKLPEMLIYDEVARLFRSTKATIRRLIKQGKFPPPIKSNQRVYRWPKETIKAWIKKNNSPSADDDTNDQ